MSRKGEKGKRRDRQENVKTEEASQNFQQLCGFMAQVHSFRKAAAYALPRIVLKVLVCLICCPCNW